MNRKRKNKETNPSKKKVRSSSNKTHIKLNKFKRKEAAYYYYGSFINSEEVNIAKELSKKNKKFTIFIVTCMNIIFVVI